MNRVLATVTLLGVDCVDIERLIRAAEISQRELTFGAVRLLTSCASDHPAVTRIPAVTTLEGYSQFMIRALRSYVNTGHVLVIQHDGFVLNASAWTDEFLEYDYIGAPWWYEDGMNVGNGGFSLRSKRLLDILADDPRVVEVHPEDQVIGRTYRRLLESRGIRFAPEKLARGFSIEGIRRDRRRDVNNVWSGQFGFHGFSRTGIAQWLRQNPSFPAPKQVHPRFL